MRRASAIRWGWGLLAACSVSGLGNAVSCLASLAAAGWRPVPLGLRPEFLGPAALAGAVLWFLLVRRLGPARTALATAPGLLGWAAGPVFARLLVPPLSSITFSHLGALRWGDSWLPVPGGAYLCVAFTGLALMGTIAGLAWALWSGTSRRWMVIALAVFAAGAWRTLVFPPSGDEPYILLSTVSILEDGDPNLNDDFALGRDRGVHNVPFRGGFIENHSVPGPRGERYSRHGFFLPFLCVPGYALFGRLGLHALMALALAFLLSRLAASLEGAAFSSAEMRLPPAALAVASPLPVFAVFLGPDLPAVLLVTLAVAAALTGRKGVFLAAVFALPWIHLKGTLLAAGLAAGVIPLRGWKWGAAGIAAVAAGVAGFLAAVGHLTQVPTWPPWAVMTYSAAQFQERLSAANLPLSALGTLFDRHQGAVHFPFLLLAFAGLAILIRIRPRLAWFTAIAAGPYLAVLLLFNQWTGGPGAPGRMLVVILPLAALPLAAAAGRLLSRPAGRLFLSASILLGTLYLWLIAAVPALAFTSGRERMERLLALRLGFDPSSLLPDIASGPFDAGAAARAGGWLAVLTLGTLLALAARRRNSAR